MLKLNKINSVTIISIIVYSWIMICPPAGENIHPCRNILKFLSFIVRNLKRLWAFFIYQKIY